MSSSYIQRKRLRFEPQLYILDHIFNHRQDLKSYWKTHCEPKFYDYSIDQYYKDLDFYWYSVQKFDYTTIQNLIQYLFVLQDLKDGFYQSI